MPGDGAELEKQYQERLVLIDQRSREQEERKKEQEESKQQD